MNAELITAPGRIDLYVRGERFASYATDGPLPGFTELQASGNRPVTRKAEVTGRALWIGHGDVNGIAFEGFEDNDRPVGKIVVDDMVARRGSQSVGFRHDCAWLTPRGDLLIHETRTVRLTGGPSDGALLDLDSDLTAATQIAVSLARSSDPFIAIRIAPTLLPAAGGQLRNSSDDFGPTEVHGKAADWCACNGVVLNETVGIAFLVHPNNLWHPAPWICREDGVLSPSPFLWRSADLRPGAPIRFRYRIVVHSGYVEAGWIHASFMDWLRR